MLDTILEILAIIFICLIILPTITVTSIVIQFLNIVNHVIVTTLTFTQMI